MPQKIHENSRVAGIKAARRYEVVEAVPSRAYTGKKFHFIGAGGIPLSENSQSAKKTNGQPGVLVV